MKFKIITGRTGNKLQFEQKLNEFASNHSINKVQLVTEDIGVEVGLIAIVSYE